MAGVGPLEGSADELEREFLENLVGRVFAAKRAKQVAADSITVPIQQSLLGLPGLLHTALVRLPDNRPKRLDPAEPQAS